MVYHNIEMLFFVSYEQQQLFCGPELIRDSGLGFWFNDGAGMLSEGLLQGDF